MGSHLETFAVKAKNNVQSRITLYFLDLPSSCMNNPFNNVENMKNKKQFQHVPLLPSFDNTNIVTFYSRIEVDYKLLLQESCIGMLNDKVKLVKFTQSFKSYFGQDLDQKVIKYNELQELIEAMQFLVQLESTKNSNNIVITSITTITSCMMMLNPPTLVKHNIIVILLWGESIIKWTLLILVCVNGK